MHKIFKNFYAINALGSIFIISFLIFTTYQSYGQPSESVNQYTEGQKVGLDISKINLPFIENVGQEDERVKFYKNIHSGSVFVTENDVTYALINNEQVVAFKEIFVTKNKLNPTGTDRAISVANYYVGNDPQDWHSKISTFDSVNLGQLWEGISVKLESQGNNFEKVFVVSPHADVSDIKVAFDGIDSYSINESGELVLNVGGKKITMTKPIAYQDFGQRTYVDVSYIAYGDETYRFSTGTYDPRYALTIDPLLNSTFLGGSTLEGGGFIAVANSGDVYVTGNTNSPNFPTVFGAYNVTYGGGSLSGDAFVSRFNGTLSDLVVSTFLGGSGDDYGLAISIDNSTGDVLVTGGTISADFPTTPGVYNTIFNGGNSDLFVSRLDSDLSTLLRSTYVGGPGSELPTDMDLGNGGRVFITGTVSALGFPTTIGAYDRTFNGTSDAFVLKLNPNLSSLLASTFLGGTNDELAYGIDVEAGRAYVTGYTTSTGFPTTPGAYNTTFNGGIHDVFVSKLNNDLSSLLASTFLGGSDTEFGHAIVAKQGKVYVTGYTESADFPTTPSAYNTTFNGGFIDAFVSRLNPSLSTLVASTFLGGSSSTDYGNDIVISKAGMVYIAGHTSSSDFPTTPNAFDTSFNGGTDAFVTKLNRNLSNIMRSTFLGGTNNDFGSRIADDPSSTTDGFVSGYTASSNFPTTQGAYDSNLGGLQDVFIAKIDKDL